MNSENKCEQQIAPKLSILHVRFFELLSQGQALQSIDPTKTGAQRHNHDNLGTVLGPLLRRLIVLYRLRGDLPWSICKMLSAPSVPELQELNSGHVIDVGPSGFLMATVKGIHA